MPPPIDVKEDYTKRKYGRDPSGFTGEMGWTVAWAPSSNSAEEAVGLRINSPMPSVPLLICTGIKCVEYNFNLSRVAGSFKQLQAPLFDGTDPLNTTLNPPRLKWRQSSRTDPIDGDVWGNPITNSAGDPFKNPAHDQEPLFGFRIRRAEPIFNPQLAVNNVNRYNSSAFAPLGIPALLPGQCRCTSILPEDEWCVGTIYQIIVYDFECARGYMQDSDNIWDAWRLRVLDQGSMGWYTDPTNGTSRGVFCDGAGRQLSVDVRLDGTGIPVDSSIGVAPAGGLQSGQTPYTPIANPNWDPPDHVNIDNGGGDGNSTWLTYDIRFRSDFNTFGF